MKKLEWIPATQKMARTGKITNMEEIWCKYFLLSILLALLSIYQSGFWSMLYFCILGPYIIIIMIVFSIINLYLITPW